MLPCKPNIPVYQISHRWIELKHEWCIHILIFFSVEEIRRNTAEFGKTIFLNREDAEEEIRKRVSESESDEMSNEGRRKNYEYDRMGKKRSRNCL